MKIFGIFLFYASIQACTPMNKDLEYYFPDEDVYRFAKCMAEEGDGFRNCFVPKNKINYQKSDIDDSPNLTQYFLLNKSKYNFTPDKLSYLLRMGSDPEIIAKYIIFSEDMEYFKAFVDGSGGPNQLNSGNWYPGSILHASIAAWDKRKVTYLVKNLGADLEQKDPIRGETAVLVARRAQKPEGSLSAIRWLIEAGANPFALDKNGAGLCDFLKKQNDKNLVYSKEDYEYINSKLNRTCPGVYTKSH